MYCAILETTGNQYWFGLRKPPCQFLFGVCPCLQVQTVLCTVTRTVLSPRGQLFGNVSYSLYMTNNNREPGGRAETEVDMYPGQTDLTTCRLTGGLPSYRLIYLPQLTPPDLQGRRRLRRARQRWRQ